MPAISFMVLNSPNVLESQLLFRLFPAELIQQPEEKQVVLHGMGGCRAV